MKTRSLSWIFSLSMACCLYPLGSRAAPSDVVAVAPGLQGTIEVTSAMLSAHLDAFPDQALDEAVQNIVDTALLAQIARVRGLDKDPLVQERRREALAWVYLKTVFEPRHLPESVPDVEAQQVYQKNLSRFVHPEVIKADHIVIGEATSKSIEMPKNETLAKKARALLESLEKQIKASPPSSDSEFLAMAPPITEDAKALGLVARGEPLGWFSLEKGQFDRGFDPVFRRQSFPVPVGEFSSVFASSFGWHIVRVSKRRLAKNETFEMVKDQVKIRMLEQVRKRELDKLTTRLAAQYPGLTDREGILSLLQIEPLIRLDAKRVLPKLE